jgi:hypothetical protein
MPAKLEIVVNRTDKELHDLKQDTMWKRPVDCRKCGNVRNLTIAEELAAMHCPVCGY